MIEVVMNAISADLQQRYALEARAFWAAGCAE